MLYMKKSVIFDIEQRYFLLIKTDIKRKTFNKKCCSYFLFSILIILQNLFIKNVS